MPTNSPTSSNPENDNIINETGTLKDVKKKFDAATDIAERLHLGTHYYVLALLERELIKRGRAGVPVIAREVMEGLASGFAVVAFNAMVQAAAYSANPSKDVMASAVEGIGALMEFQSDVIQRMIREVTPPKGVTRQ